MQKVMFKGKWVCLHMPLVFGKIDLRIFEINLVYIAASFSIFPFVYLICTISSRASSRKWGHCCSVCEKRHRSPTKRKKKNLTAIFIYFTTRNYLKYYEKYFLFYWKNSFYSEDIVYSFCFTFLALLPVVHPASNCKNYKRNLLNETYFERRLSKHSKNLTFQPPHLNFEGLKEKGCNYKNWNISRRKSAF